MLKGNLERIFNTIKDGNNLGESITLVGATKMVDPSIINQAVDLGLKVVAENKVQEFRDKHLLINNNAEQHFIGHLQTNKVKYLVGNVSLIQSVDSVKLALEIDRIAKNKGVVQDVLIEINVGGELTKSGFDLNNAINETLAISNQCKNLRILGLMAMLPNSQDQDYLSSLCDKARSLYDELKQRDLPFKYLSMGMSNDYLLTIKHGSNMIRLGRDIFGQRNYNKQ